MNGGDYNIPFAFFLKKRGHLEMNFLDTHTLLHPKLPNWRETIRQEAAGFIMATGRFRDEIPYYLLQILDPSICNLVFL